MNTVLRTTATLLSMLTLMCQAHGGPTEPDVPPSTSPASGVVGKAEHAVARGANAAASGVELAVKAAASGVERGVNAAARGVAHGAQATASAVSQVTRKISGTPASAPAGGR